MKNFHFNAQGHYSTVKHEWMDECMRVLNLFAKKKKNNISTIFQQQKPNQWKTIREKQNKNKKRDF